MKGVKAVLLNALVHGTFISFALLDQSEVGVSDAFDSISHWQLLLCHYPRRNELPLLLRGLGFWPMSQSMSNCAVQKLFLLEDSLVLMTRVVFIRLE